MSEMKQELKARDVTKAANVMDLEDRARKEGKKTKSWKRLSPRQET